MTQVKTDTRCLTRGLGGEEGIEDLIENLFFHTDTIIVEVDGNAIIADGGLDGHLGLVSGTQVLLHNGIDAVGHHAHEDLAQQIGIDIDMDGRIGIFEHGTDVVLADLLGIIRAHHLLVLTEDGTEVGIDNAAATILQHLLHGLQGAGGVLTMLAHLLQVA